MGCDLRIIGISNTDCECFDKDTDTNLSGIYLNELEGFSLQKLKDTEICEQGTWDEHCELAITNAKTDLFNDVIQNITNTNLYEKIKNQEALIGSTINNGLLINSKKYLIYRLVLKNNLNSVLKIKGFGLYFDQTKTFNILVYNGFGTLIKTITVTSTADKYKYQAVTSVELTTNTIGMPYTEYFFVVDISENTPYTTKHICCGDNYKFDYSNPCYLKDNSGWRNFAMWGYDLQDTLDIEALRQETPYYKNFCGLSLNVEYDFDYWSLICNTNIDYEADDIGISTALALRYRTASIIYNDILNRPNVDQTTIESTLALISFWDSRYAKHVNFIATSNEVLNNGCFKRKKLMARIGGRF